MRKSRYLVSCNIFVHSEINEDGQFQPNNSTTKTVVSHALFMRSSYSIVYNL